LSGLRRSCSGSQGAHHVDLRIFTICLLLGFHVETFSAQIVPAVLGPMQTFERPDFKEDLKKLMLYLRSGRRLKTGDADQRRVFPGPTFDC